MKIEPYLFFNGRCDEALAFYKQAIGAEVQFLMRFKESPEPAMHPPGFADKVMHATFKVGDTEIMASDGRCDGNVSFQGFGLAINVANSDQARRYFDALGQGGQIQMPLGKTFFSPAFGMVIDKFGVLWMVMAAAS
jgi:PhnB protein